MSTRSTLPLVLQLAQFARRSPAYAVFPALRPSCGLAARAGPATHAAAVEEAPAPAPPLSWPELRPLAVPEPHQAAEPELLARLGDRLLQGSEPQAGRLRVALLLSGGVDSSVALRLLQAAGHAVTAFYLQIWFQEDFRNTWAECPWEADLAVCQQVCGAAGVPLEVVPLTREYWGAVVGHCLAETLAGRTPNPDVLCNSRVKFGAFYEHLERQHAGAFDRVASGHYARLLRAPAGPHTEPTPPVQLAAAPDPVKDQTYFLAHLSQGQLGRALFPLGPFTKAEVRGLARHFGLPNSLRRDSQGLCFLGKVHFEEFLREHLGEWPGPVVEEATGQLLCTHRGFWFHTVGQRRGIDHHSGPWYVTRKDCELNTVYVAKRGPGQEPSAAADSRSRVFWASGLSWVRGPGQHPLGNLPPLGASRAGAEGRPLGQQEGPEAGGEGLPLGPGSQAELQCKVRHGPHLYGCQVELSPSGSHLRVELDAPDEGLAAGQFVVFYDGGVCLGCGIIETSEPQ